MAEFGEERGWQDKKSLVECLMYSLEKEIRTDVTFTIRSSSVDCEPTKIAAHKFMLGKRSRVFEEMFFGRSAQDGDEVIVDDTKPEAFKEMLRYVYTEDVQLTEDNVLDVLHLARKFAMERLAMMCLKYARKNIKWDAVCSWLNHAIKCGEKELTKICLHASTLNTWNILESNFFRELSEPALFTFLKHDCFGIKLEEKIIKACLSWAEAQNKHKEQEKTLREILGDCLYQMRFFQLSGEKFAEMFDTSSLLTEEEKNAFLWVINTQNATRAQKIRDFGFSTHYRCVVWDNNRYSRGNTKSSLNNEREEEINFSLNCACYITDVAVLGKGENKQQVVDIELKEESSDTVLATIQTTFISPGGETIPVFFEGKVRLEPEKRYVLKATLPSLQNCRSITKCSGDHTLGPSVYYKEQYNWKGDVKINYRASIPSVCEYGYIKEVHFAKCLI